MAIIIRNGGFSAECETPQQAAELFKLLATPAFTGSVELPDVAAPTPKRAGRKAAAAPANGGKAARGAVKAAILEAVGADSHPDLEALAAELYGKDPAGLKKLKLAFHRLFANGDIKKTKSGDGWQVVG